MFELRSEPEERRFKHFYVTDSCPEVARAIHGKGPFEVLPLAESIIAAVTQYLD